MQITILGKGNMGLPLARILTTAGHQVASLNSSDDPTDALAGTDIVVLAMKYEQALTFAARPGISDLLRGKIIVDITNPLSPDFMSLTVGHDTSGAEEIAKRLPGARVVKAFNTIFASVLADHADGKPCRLPIMIAGDDTAAVAEVEALVQGMELESLLSGKLANARYLEPMTGMMIQLGYGLGHGDRIGFALNRQA